MTMDSLAQSYEESAVTEGLFCRAREGDPSAYEQLFRHVQHRLTLYIRGRLGRELLSKLELDDIVQETYLEAHKDFDAFQNWGEGSFCRWLFGVAENCIRRASGRARAAKRTAPGGRIRASEGLQFLAAQGAGPGTELQENEESEELVRALSQLSETSRELLMLRYFQELTLDALARHFQLPKSTIQSRLARATLELGRVMKSKG